jgi:acyl carrier protein
LPGYMVPGAFAPLTHFPLTNNGKLDVAALPRPSVSETVPVAEATGDATERAIAEIWAKILGLQCPFDHDANFFDLGGHSLLLVRMADALEARFGIVLNEIDLLEATTVRTLAAKVRLASAPSQISNRAYGRSARQATGLDRLRNARRTTVPVN